MQLMPRFTGDSGSPFTATTRPCFVAIWMPQPTPQKRHTPLSHWKPASASSLSACASASRVAGKAKLLATEAATAVFRKSRRV
jgi:hypothetical protein